MISKEMTESRRRAAQIRWKKYKLNDDLVEIDVSLFYPLDGARPRPEPFNWTVPAHRNSIQPHANAEGNNYKYQDTGCKYHPSCLNCPEPDCRRV